MRTIPQTPNAVLDRLTGLHPKLIDLSLDRVERLLERLGNPHQKLPPVVHVAGTNGKGSVVAFMRTCLQEAGYRVHVYTSPHLVRFNERIVLAGEAITDELLVPILEECEAANKEDPITFFEITTVAAFLAFARHDADIVLLETGLGGRLDATNLIAKPALTVITPISIDHQQFLGETLADIAAEKAGILKAGVPAVFADQPADAARVLHQQAEVLGAPLMCEGTDFTARADNDQLVVRIGDSDHRFPVPALPGAHQLQNAALAIAGLQRLDDFSVDDEAMARGLQTVDWPARLQNLTKGPLAAKLPDGWALWLDGGHNQAAGHVLADHCNAWRAADDKPLYLIFGMLNSKDPAPFLAPLKNFTNALFAVSIPGVQASLSAHEGQAAAQKVGIPAVTAADVETALTMIIEKESNPARVLICGSLYLAGAVLKENN